MKTMLRLAAVTCIVCLFAVRYPLSKLGEADFTKAETKVIAGARTTLP